ncbi:thermonuclease family protein [Kordiimonas pumila]|uniref:Thermonuclease family protein n=1 Tax=Kordiimonas pumila TaxID=2161677 RepID=A0ABV7D831_9PROT|nr:thermonuclease family protein [Kordiimonas pumila]
MTWPLAFIFVVIFMVYATTTTADIELVGAEVRHVYDGDTITVKMHDTYTVERVRLLDIDTAELGSAKCVRERALALKQRDTLKSLLTTNVSLAIEGRDRYGRLLAVVYNEHHENVNATMLRTGYARPYAGGIRRGWC